MAVCRTGKMPMFLRNAGVAELADALDSKSSDRKVVWVRAPPPAVFLIERWALDLGRLMFARGKTHLCAARSIERCLQPSRKATAWQATSLGMTTVARDRRFAGRGGSNPHDLARELIRYCANRFRIRAKTNNCGGQWIRRLCLCGGERTTMFSREREGSRPGWRRTA